MTTEPEPNVTAEPVEPAHPDGRADPDEPEEPDTLAVLARDLRGPVVGYPRQRVTLLLIAVLVIVSMFVALGVLIRDGMPT